MRRILIIDDDQATRDIFRARLEDAYEVFETGDSEEGIGLALEHKPDAILLDLLMPKFSGFELCQTLRTISFTETIPVFIFSGEAASKYEAFCINLGAAGYFEKPVDFEILKAALAKALRCKRPELRSAVRIRLSMELRLQGTNQAGDAFDFSAVTENISAEGFLCNCPDLFDREAVVNVFLGQGAGKFAGAARAVRTEFRNNDNPRYEFQFLEKPVHWVLQ